jgi:hypothetical protein
MEMRDFDSVSCEIKDRYMKETAGSYVICYKEKPPYDKQNPTNA